MNLTSKRLEELLRAVARKEFEGDVFEGVDLGECIREDDHAEFKILADEAGVGYRTLALIEYWCRVTDALDEFDCWAEHENDSVVKIWRH